MVPNRKVSSSTFKKVTLAAAVTLCSVKVRPMVSAKVLTNSIIQQDTTNPTVRKNKRKLLNSRIVFKESKNMLLKDAQV